MKQYKDQIEKILTNSQSEIETCSGKIEAAKKEVEKAEADMSAALLSGNDTAYIAAKKDRDNAEESLRMFTDRMDVLANGPLISAEQYNSMVTEIMGAIEKANTADKKEAAKLCEKLIALAKKNLAMIEDGNATLHSLQYDVYRGDDIPKRSNGEFVLDFSGRRDKQFVDNNSLFGWAHYALFDCVQYTAFKESVSAES